MRSRRYTRNSYEALFYFREDIGDLRGCCCLLQEFSAEFCDREAVTLLQRYGLVIRGAVGWGVWRRIGEEVNGINEGDLIGVDEDVVRRKIAVFYPSPCNRCVASMRRLQQFESFVWSTRSGDDLAKGIPVAPFLYEVRPGVRKAEVDGFRDDVQRCA